MIILWFQMILVNMTQEELEIVGRLFKDSFREGKIPKVHRPKLGEILANLVLCEKEVRCFQIRWNTMGNEVDRKLSTSSYSLQAGSVEPPKCYYPQVPQS